VGSTRRSDAATRYGPTGQVNRTRSRTGRCTAESAHTKASRDASSPAACDGSPPPGCLGQVPDALVLVPVSGLSPGAVPAPCHVPGPSPILMAAEPDDGRVGSRPSSRVHEPRNCPGAIARRSPAVLTGSGSHRYSCGGFGGRAPTLPPACRLPVPGLIRRLAPVWRCRSRLRRAGSGTGRPGVLPGRSAGTGCRGSRCTGRAARCGCG
jgi:hypothetical protein